MKEFNKHRVLSSELQKYIGKLVFLKAGSIKARAWWHDILVLRDRAGLVQILDEKSEESKKLKGLQNGTILRVEGMVVEEKRATSGVKSTSQSLPYLSLL